MSIGIFSAYLSITFIFLLFLFRAIYFTFVIKDDPIKAVSIKLNWIDKVFKKLENSEKQKYHA